MSQPVFLDSRSILLSTPKGLKRLYVPFNVMVCTDVESYKVGDRLQVTLVGFTKKDNLLYYIGDNYFSYRFFVIIDAIQHQ